MDQIFSRITLQKRAIVVAVIVVVTLIVLGFLTGVVEAQDADRINRSAHLGGAGVYCVDGEMTPSRNMADGGILVLQPFDGAIEEALFAPSTLLPDLSEGLFMTDNMLLTSGNTTFGQLDLWFLSNGQFQLNGIDEHGKWFEFAWAGCDPTEKPVTSWDPAAVLESLNAAIAESETIA